MMSRKLHKTIFSHCFYPEVKQTHLLK